MSVHKYILAIDQGTTGTNVALFDRSGAMVAQADHDFRQIYPKPGWVEHDPDDIWNSVTANINKVLQQVGSDGRDIAGIGITNQRETTVVWERDTHKPIYNAIVWQCRRTSDFCDKLRKNKKTVKIVKEKTGLVIDPYFSATKINWILKNTKGALSKAKTGQLAAGTIDSFLIWKLSGGHSHKTDVSNASRTQLMNIKTGSWDPVLLKLFGVPADVLPQICDSSGAIATTKGLGILPDGIPISGVAGDQQSALFGQGCFSPGEAKCTYGTGSFILLNTGDSLKYSRSGCLTTVAWRLKGQKKMTYALEGSVFICGAAVQWLRDGLGFIQNSNEIENLANSVSDTGGVEFVPALTGLGAPHWRANARGIITGLTRGTTRAHIARATLEAMALQNCEILTAMEKDSGKKLKMLKVDGGASANNLLMQIQSDYLGTNIERPKMTETTVLGAAFLAGLGVGFWSGIDEIRKNWKLDRKFEPHMKLANRKERLARWSQSVNKA